MKTCTRCGTPKDTAEFYRNKGSRDGRLAMCRTCVGARQRDYVAANREKVAAGMKAYHSANRDRLLEQQRTYKAKHKARLRALKRQIETGFSPELFDATLILQRGKCGICDRDLAALPPHQVHADHCHTTRQPRGVLCHPCNTALGKLGDNAESIRQVLKYLENPPAQTIIQPTCSSGA